MRTILFAAVALTGLGLLIAAVMRLVRLVKSGVLVRLPLAARLPFTLGRPGAVVLYAEAPLASTAFRGNQYATPPAFRGLTYAIRRDDTGEAVPLGSVFGAPVSSGFRSTRVPLARFVIDRPGAFTMDVHNLVPSAETERCAFVLAESRPMTMVLAILAIVVSGVMLIGGIVFTILDVSGALP